ncbi:Nascent polypeptide-associated complex subunit beta [Pyricularia grisea]|nr:Nascent polypeptide-associated complex subunit beta [Pyricularia grisea]
MADVQERLKKLGASARIGYVLVNFFFSQASIDSRGKTLRSCANDQLPACTTGQNGRFSVRKTGGGSGGDEGKYGKGTPRRKMKRAPARSGGDDKKLQQTLKKLNVQPIQAIEEVNMFKSDGNVIHFAAPKVHAAVPANTFAIYGNGEDKELTELVPGILNQLGPDSLASLRKLAESYQNMQKADGDKEADDDDIPDLVAGENFEDKVE